MCSFAFLWDDRVKGLRQEKKNLENGKKQFYKQNLKEYNLK